MDKLSEIRNKIERLEEIRDEEGHLSLNISKKMLLAYLFEDKMCVRHKIDT